ARLRFRPGEDGGEPRARLAVLVVGPRLEVDAGGVVADVEHEADARATRRALEERRDKVAVLEDEGLLQEGAGERQLRVPVLDVEVRLAREGVAGHRHREERKRDSDDTRASD